MRALRPTARGLGVAVAGVALLLVGVFTGTAALESLGALALVPVALAPLVAGWRAEACRQGLAVHLRVVPPIVRAGEAVRVEVSAANRARREMPPVGLDRRIRRPGATPAPDRLAPGPADLLRLPGLRAGGTETLGVTRRMRRRGRFDLGSGPAWVHDHFGLCGVRVTRLPPAVVVVHPVAVPVPPTGPGEGARALGPREPVLVTPAPGREDSELIGLRPYVPGDRLHLLHWPTTDRGDGPFVKEFGADPAAVLHVVVDDRAGVHLRRAFEEMLGIAVTVLADAAGRGWAVELSTSTGRHCTVPPGAAGWAQAATFLAMIQPRRAAAGTGSRPPGAEPATVLTTSTAAPTLAAHLQARGTRVIAP